MRGAAAAPLALACALFLLVGGATGQPHTPSETGVVEGGPTTADLIAAEEKIAERAAKRAGLIKEPDQKVDKRVHNVALGDYPPELGLAVDPSMAGMDLISTTMARERAFPGLWQNAAERAAAAADAPVMNETVNGTNSTNRSEASNGSPFRKQKVPDAAVADPVLFNTTTTCKHCMLAMLALEKMYIEGDPANNMVGDLATAERRNSSVCALVTRSYFPAMYGVVLKEQSDEAERSHYDAMEGCMQGIGIYSPARNASACVALEQLGIRPQTDFTPVERKMNKVAKQARIENIRAGIRDMASARDAMHLCSTMCGACTCPSGYSCMEPNVIADVADFLKKKKDRNLVEDSDKEWSEIISLERKNARENKFIMPPNITLKEPPQISPAMEAARLAKLKQAEAAKLAQLAAMKEVDDTLPADELTPQDPAAVPPPAPPDSAIKDVCESVTLYEHANFLGKKIVLKQGDHGYSELLDSIGAKAQSAKLSEDCVLAMYKSKNFDGGVQYLSETSSDFALFGLADIGSALQSIKILPSDGSLPVTAQVTLSVRFALALADRIKFDSAFVADMAGSLSVPGTSINVQDVSAGSRHAANGNTPAYHDTIVTFQVVGNDVKKAKSKFATLRKQKQRAFTLPGNASSVTSNVTSNVTLSTGNLALFTNTTVAMSDFEDHIVRKGDPDAPPPPVGMASFSDTLGIKADQDLEGGKNVDTSMQDTASACMQACATHAMCEAWSFKEGSCALMAGASGTKPRVGYQCGFFKPQELNEAYFGTNLQPLLNTYPIQKERDEGRISSCSGAGKSIGRFKCSAPKWCARKCEMTLGCNVFNFGRGQCVLDNCPSSNSGPSLKYSSAFGAYAVYIKVNPAEALAQRLAAASTNTTNGSLSSNSHLFINSSMSENSSMSGNSSMSDNSSLSAETGAPVEKNVCRAQDNVKNDGGTKIKELVNQEEEGCCDACYDEPRCESWLFAIKFQKCVLLSGVSKTTTDSKWEVNTFRYGIVERPLKKCEGMLDTTTVGGELIVKTSGRSKGSCCAECIDDANCDAWKFNSKNGDCFTYKGANETASLPGFIVGLRPATAKGSGSSSGSGSRSSSGGGSH